MPDLIQVANDLKEMPDQWLGMQAQNPSGVVPPYLVVAEIARRQKLRSGAAQAQAPQSSVSQDLIRSLQARMPPAHGLPPGSVPTQATPPGMPPVNLTGGGSGGLGSPAPGTPPAQLRMPGRMARGGPVGDDDEDYADDGSDGSDGNDGNDGDSANADLANVDLANLPMRRNPTRDQALAQLYSVKNVPAVRYSDPRFQPMQPFAPGAGGQDVYGRNLPLPAVPQAPDVSSELEEKDRYEGLVAQKPEDVTSPENVAKYTDLAERLSGGAPDTSAYDQQSQYLHDQALKAKPTWQRALIEWGARLAASPSHYFGQAAGQAAVGTLSWADQQKEQMRQLELARLRTQASLAEKLATYKQRVGAETASIMNTAERQKQAERNANLQHLYKVTDTIQKKADGYQKAQTQVQDQVTKQSIAAGQKHMNLEAALAGLSDDDPKVVNASQNFLDNKTSFDTDLAAVKEDHRDQVARALFDYKNNVENQQRVAAATLAHQRRVDDKAAAPGGERKWTDADRRTAGLSMITDELGKVAKVGNTYYDANGWPVKDAAGNDIKTPSQLYQVAKERAAEHVMDPDLYKDHPHFGVANPNGDAERERVHNRIRAAIVPKDVSNALIGRHFQPTAEGMAKNPALKPAPTSAPKQPQATQPQPQQQPAPQQPQPTQPGGTPPQRSGAPAKAPAGWAAPGTPGVPLVPAQMATRPAGSQPLRNKVTGDIWWKDANGNVWHRKENAVQ
jgi:hypothetical protein